MPCYIEAVISCRFSLLNGSQLAKAIAVHVRRKPISSQTVSWGGGLNTCWTLQLKKSLTTYSEFAAEYSNVNVVEGPTNGLRMTLNVQQYENWPFVENDSGLKVILLFL